MTKSSRLLFLCLLFQRAIAVKRRLSALVPNTTKLKYSLVVYEVLLGLTLNDSN